MERPRFDVVLDPSRNIKQYFGGNEDKVFIVFVYCNNNNTLIGLSGEIPAGWKGKRVMIGGKEYETTPVYDLPGHIAIVGEGVRLGQEIEFV